MMMKKKKSYANRNPFTRHGGAFDRGAADGWYGREYDPHYYVGATYVSQCIGVEDMSIEEKEAYAEGYYSA